MTKKKQRDLKRVNKKPQIIIIFVLAIIGVRILTLSHAQPPAASVEAESGSLTAPAVKVPNPGASGDLAVQFGTACISPLVDIHATCFYGGPVASSAEPGTCNLSVPANPLTAAGLATPYVMSGDLADCQQSNIDDSAFIQAVILAPNGSVSIYDPLIVNAGQSPAIPPATPSVPAGSTVAIWFGFNNIYLHLIGAGAGSCTNGLPNSDFGQYVECNAPAWFAAANADVSSGKLVVPPLGTSNIGQTCPTVNSFEIVDQDPNDNVQTSYLANLGTNAIAQNSAANAAQLKGDAVLANPSDNALLSLHVDPAIGCTPWLAPVQENPGAVSPSLALDQLQAAKEQPAPAAYVELTDEMTLVAPGKANDNDGTTTSMSKTNLYRTGVDQPADINADEKYFCTNLAKVFPSWLQANRVAFTAAASPDPAAANSLYTFLGGRFIGTYEMQLPAPGVVPTCDKATGIKDPLSMVANAAGVTTSISIH